MRIMAATTPSPLSVAIIPTTNGISPAKSMSCSLLFCSEILSKTQLKPLPSHLALVKPHSFILPSRQSQRTYLSVHPFPKKKPSPFPLCAVKKGKNGGGNFAVTGSNDFVEEDEDGDEDEFDFLDDDGEYDNDDVEDGEMLLLLEKMQKWLERKPRGFGEGKVYDTSIEDKLLEEMLQSQMAQAANVNNLKNNPIKPRSKVEDSKRKAAEAVPSGVRVLLTNLPKKKNVQRDLRSAFKEFRGILDMVPVVSGNQKTKDPICKGFAYVNFKSEVDAARFVQQFSGESIAFGKIQKQIKCRIAKAGSGTASGDALTEIDMDGSAFKDEVSDESNNAVDNDDDDHNNNNEILETQMASAIESMKSFSVSELNIIDNKEDESGSSSSSKKKGTKKSSASTKKSSASTKKKVQKVAKLDIPGSAKRLKVRDKAVLTDVFIKYGLQAAVATKEES